VAEPPLLLMTRVARRFGVARAVQDASLAVPRGATVGVLGESGSGKSTLARLATGLLRPDAGEILYAGAPLHRRATAPRRIAMVFQDPAGSLDPRWSIGRSIAEPVAALGLRGGKAAVRDRVLRLMSDVGLPEQLIDRHPRDLSLGQAQRAAVARALAGEPDLLVADEPTSALDISVQAQVLNGLRDAQDRMRLAILLISHDVGVVRHMADLVAVMHGGRVVEFGPADAVFARPRHPYTRLLLASVPDLSAPRRSPEPAGPAEAPRAVAPGLCAFQPRCPLAIARCAATPPPLVDVDGVAVACHAVAGA
jgi:peptide/nickel transport system ATP-binding protein